MSLPSAMGNIWLASALAAPPLLPPAASTGLVHSGQPKQRIVGVTAQAPLGHIGLELMRAPAPLIRATGEGRRPQG